MALGDVVQASDPMGGAGTLTLPSAPTAGNRVLLVWGSSESGGTPTTPSGWTVTRSRGFADGQNRRATVFHNDTSPQSVTVASFEAAQVSQLFEVEGAGGALLESGTWSSAFSNTDPASVELDSAVDANCALVALFVTGNADRAFDEGSWAGGYTHGTQHRFGSARFVWGHRSGASGTASAYPATVSYADSPPQTLAVVVAFAEDTEAPPTKLAAPDVTLDSIGNPSGPADGTADVSWPAVTDADTYRVEIAEGLDATSGFTVLAESHASLSFEATGLGEGAYTVGVVAKPSGASELAESDRGTVSFTLESPETVPQTGVFRVASGVLVPVYPHMGTGNWSV